MKKFSDNPDRLVEILAVVSAAQALVMTAAGFYKEERTAAIKALAEIDDEFAAFPSDKQARLIEEMVVGAKEILGEYLKKEKEIDEHKSVSTRVH